MNIIGYIQGHIDFPPGDGVVYGHNLACDYDIHVQRDKVWITCHIKVRVINRKKIGYFNIKMILLLIWMCKK